MHIQEEAARCLLCADAPCSKTCKNGDPARAIRAIRFGNEAIAGQWVENCKEAELQTAEEACIHYDKPIRIRELAAAVKGSRPQQKLPSLAIDFCGIHCESPFFLASSAVCTNYEMVARAFEAGWAGVFYKTVVIRPSLSITTCVSHTLSVRVVLAVIFAVLCVLWVPLVRQNESSKRIRIVLSGYPLQ